MAGRIDTHHHVVPPSYVDWLARLGVGAGAGVPFPRWSREETLEIIDRRGIETAIVSLSTPGVHFGDAAEARKRAREINELSAGLVRSAPARFGFFAFLPLPDVDGTLAEIEYAFDTLKADGAGFMTSYGDQWPGDEAFLPVLAELNRRNANVFVHPLAPNCCAGLVPNVGDAVVEYPYDTGRAVLSLLFNGRLVAYRDINWIFCHAGGPVPMLAGRIEGSAQRTKERERFAPQGVAHEFRRLHYETANSAYAPTLAALQAFVPRSQILFGTDFPYIAVADNVERLGNLALPADDLAAIEKGNAARLFPRVQSR